MKAKGDLGPMLSADPLWVPGVPMMRNFSNWDMLQGEVRNTWEHL